ncbi:hypothetical protein J6590_055651 [Homalodisca vitripennis]|nr:hypothetical protein J6590_055651 [Homalodisca vitripennis]
MASTASVARTDPLVHILTILNVLFDGWKSPRFRSTAAPLGQIKSTGRLNKLCLCCMRMSTTRINWLNSATSPLRAGWE